MRFRAASLNTFLTPFVKCRFHSHECLYGFENIYNLKALCDFFILRCQKIIYSIFFFVFIFCNLFSIIFFTIMGIITIKAAHNRRIFIQYNQKMFDYVNRNDFQQINKSKNGNEKYLLCV